MKSLDRELEIEESIPYQEKTNQHGVYDYDAEEQAIIRRLNLKEFVQFRRKDKKALRYLTAVADMVEAVQNFECGARVRFGALMDALQDCEELFMDPKVKPRELDAVKCIMSAYRNIVDNRKKIEALGLQIIDSWFINSPDKEID